MSAAVEERANAEIVHGPENCYNHSLKLLQELGFPKGILPLKDLEECGLVWETGFVWMKQKAPYEHFFVKTKTLVKYDTEVTAYVEKGKMKKVTGIRTKQLMMWVPLVEMSVEEKEKKNKKSIYFKTPMGIGRSFPASAFTEDDEGDE